MHKKESGTYYTPIRTVEFMCDYVAKYMNSPGSILEPSAGDGRFIRELQKKKYGEFFTAVEYDSDKIPELKKKISSDLTCIRNEDFLKTVHNCGKEYDLIIGNPPYISIKNMEKTFLDEARKLCRVFSLPESMIKNSWVAFILGAMRVLAPGGCIFFVLPMEFLQVQYAEVLRAFIEKHFNTIHILTFYEKMFPEIEQNTCLVYLGNESEEAASILYRQYSGLADENVLFESQIKRNKPLKKWTNAILSDSDIDLLRRLADRYPLISALSSSAPGIVTGANKIFILNKSNVNRYHCQKFIKPIIAKASMVRNSFRIDGDLIQRLSDAGESIFFLDLNGVSESDMSKELVSYLIESGRIKRNNTEIRNNYKCSHRDPWYIVPVPQSGGAAFFKRYDTLPRVCVKSEKIFTTDIAYNLFFKKGIEADSFVFSFYNSLTLALCEYLGRYYAGGVSELIPREFKQLSIPYRHIEKKDLQKLEDMFHEDASIEDILDFVDSCTLGKDVSRGDIHQLRKIRKMLISRRKS